MASQPLRILVVDADASHARQIALLLHALHPAAYTLTHSSAPPDAADALPPEFDLLLLHADLLVGASRALTTTARAQVPLVLLTETTVPDADRWLAQTNAHDYLPLDRLDADLLRRTLRSIRSAGPLPEALDVTQVELGGAHSSGALQSMARPGAPRSAGAAAVPAGSGAAAQLAALTAATADALLGLALDGTIRTWNDAARALFGYSAAEIVGKSFGLLLPPELAPGTALLERVARTKQPTVREAACLAKGGHPCPVALTLAAVRDSRGYAVGVVCIARDLSELKRVATRSVAAERSLQALLDNARDAFYQIDLRTGAFAYASAAAAEVLGFSVAELVAGGSALIRDQLFPDDAERYTAQIAALRQPDSVSADATLEYRFRTRHRGWRWLSDRRSLVRDAAGHALALVGNIRDITDSKHAGENIRSKEQRFRRVIETTQEGVFMVELPSTITYVNARMATLLGYTSRELLGRSIFELIPLELHAAVRHQLSHRHSGPSAQAEVQLIHKSGALIWCTISASVMLDEAEQVIGSFGMLHDITERKRAEEAATRSVAQLGRAQRIAQLGSWEWDAATASVEFSDELYRIFGLERGDPRLAFPAVWRLIHPDDALAAREAFTALQRGAFAGVELRIVRPDGTVRAVDVQAEFVFDEQGQPLRTIGTLLDITERKQAEAELDRFFTLSPDLLSISGADGYFRRVNPAWTQKLGWSNAELLRTPYLELVHPDDRASTLAEATRLVEGAVVLDFENRYRCRDGSYRRLLWKSAPDAATGNSYAVAHDVTELRAADEALRDSQERLEVALHSAQVGLWEWDILSDSTTYSPQYKRLIGYEGSDVGNSMDEWASRLHPAEREAVWEALQRQLSGGGTRYESAFRMRHKDDSYRWIMSRGTIFRAADGTPLRILGTIVDITELKAAALQLQHAHDELEQRVAERTLELVAARDEAERANAAKSEFLSRMSHELRTPLNSILGFAQIMEMDELAPRQAQRTDHIMAAGRHLLRLINEVLDLARVEAGHLDISPEPVAVRESITSAVDLIRPQLEQRHQPIVIDHSPVASIYVHADQQRLAQVLLNLLSNASKYSPSGTEMRVVVAPRPDDRVRISVIDRGPGLSAASLNRLFQPFERLDAGQSTTEGTGLGLALSKRLVELMGGTVGVESQVGHGSCFWVELARTHSPVDHANAEVPNKLDIVTSRQRTVLYIEDNLANLEVIEHVLGNVPNIRLVSAMQGQLGLDLAREHHPALILLDLHLPDILGDEVLRRLQADQQTQPVPVVIISADATPRQMRRLMEAGAAEYLTKPLDIRLFIEVISKMLRLADGVVGY